MVDLAKSKALLDLTWLLEIFPPLNCNSNLMLPIVISRYFLFAGK
jgi:hypothetical protein